MATPKCTGLNCPVQYEYADPKTCQEPEKCPYATFPQTNADRIRAMTDEELVDVIGCPFGIDADICFPQKSCAVCMLKWLRSPAEREGETP